VAGFACSGGLENTKRSPLGIPECGKATYARQVCGRSPQGVRSEPVLLGKDGGPFRGRVQRDEEAIQRWKEEG